MSALTKIDYTHSDLWRTEMNLKTLRTIIFILEISFIYIMFSLNKEIISFLSGQTDWSEDVIKSIINMFTAGALGHLIVSGVSVVFKSVEEKNNDVSAKFVEVKVDMNDIKDAMSEGFKYTKEKIEVLTFDNKEAKKSISSLSYKMDETIRAVEEISEHKDDKKRWYREFEDDWRGMRGGILELGNNDVYGFAKLTKDCIRDFCMECHASTDYSKDVIVLLDYFEEKGQTFKYELYKSNENLLPDKFFNMLKEICAKDEFWLKEEVQKVLNDRVNRRDEGIQLTFRQFLRRVLNNIYLSYSRFIIENKEELAKDSCGKRMILGFYKNK